MLFKQTKTLKVHYEEVEFRVVVKNSTIPPQQIMKLFDDFPNFVLRDVPYITQCLWIAEKVTCYA